MPRTLDNTEHRDKILQKEARNFDGINQLISVTTIRPQLRRRITLQSVLFFINFIARYVQNRGQLSGIETIYFARWIKIDRGMRLLFISHYYGDWERYLDEYIDNASSGLTAIWGNTIGFPRSQWLTGSGARNENDFKSFARISQQPSLFAYCAYPAVSVVQIQNNIYLRDLLNKADRSDAECETLLALL